MYNLGEHKGGLIQEVGQFFRHLSQKLQNAIFPFYITFGKNIQYLNIANISILKQIISVKFNNLTIF